MEKFLNLMSSQRFWLYLFSMVGLVFGLPELTSNADGLSKNLASQIQVVVQSAGFLVTTVTLIVSYAIREPERKKIEKALPDMDALKKALAELLKK